VKRQKFKLGIKYFFGILIILYPLLVFSSLVIFKIGFRYLSAILIVMSVAYAIINKHNYKGRKLIFVFISPAILFAIGGLCFVLPFFYGETGLFYSILVKIYPALADLVFLTIMATSIFIPPNLVFSVVNLFDKKLKFNIDTEYYRGYCRRCAIAWCIYFVIDAIICLITTFFKFNVSFIKSDDPNFVVWAIYNSGITYFLMGIIFAVQYGFIKVMEGYVLNVVNKKDKTEQEVTNG